MTDSAWTSVSSPFYNVAGNWTSAIVPDGTAYFHANTFSQIVFNAPTTSVGSWQLNSVFQFYVDFGQVLHFTGAGITGLAAGGTVLSIGGTVVFENASTAGDTIVVNSSSIYFDDTSSAGTSSINNTSSVIFMSQSTAGSAEIENSFNLRFRQASTAGDASIINEDDLVFEDQSNAGTAAVTNEDELTFDDQSHAGSSVITNRGELIFAYQSNAAYASIDNKAGSLVEFRGVANAAFAYIAGAGNVAFREYSTAGDATLTTALSHSGEAIEFFNNSSAGTATINASSVTIGLAFRDNSTASSATINANAGMVAFTQSASAGSATINNSSSSFVFLNSSTASTATISNIGFVRFLASSSPADAQLINKNAGVFDLSFTSGSSGDGRLTAGSLAGTGRFQLGDNRLTVGSNNLSTTVTGVIEDGGSAGAQTGASLVKIGAGTLTLAGANTYSGGTTIDAGVVQIDGSVQGNVVVNAGAGLAGRGTVAGLVTANAGALIAPGASPGALTVGNLTMASGARLALEIGGAVAVVQHDVLVVNGTVSFNNATLETSLVGGFSPSLSASQTFQLVENDGTDAVAGTFAGLAQDAAFAIGNRVFTISYKAGTGNDVVLTSEGALIVGTAGKDTVSPTVAPAGQLKATPLADKILGLGGNDKLAASGGNDTVQGGAGKDTMDGGGGRDTADYSDKGKAVVVTLNGSHAATVKVNGKAEDSIKSIEGLIGSGKADKLSGDSKANTFDGRLGKDILTGDSGKDKFLFSTALATSNVDTITDFRSGQDKLVLDDAIFAAIGPKLDKAEFYAKAGAIKAHDASDRIVYDTKSGKLYYDDDGKGGHAAVQFATLSSHPGLGQGDFTIV